MHLNPYLPTLLIVVLVALQYATGHAIVPNRLRVRFVPKAKRPYYYRAIVHFWIALGVLYVAGVAIITHYR